MAFLDPFVLIGTATLIIQIIVLILLFLGYSYKRKLKFRQHGVTMASALILHLIMILAIMIPSFVLAVIPEYILPAPLMLVSLTSIIHGITGVIALVLGTYLVAAWRFKKEVKDCFKRKNIMRLTLTAWLVALITGIMMYAIFYIPLILS
jgi:uncharacterized membrane protein YozB (DUF420 family)